MLQTLAITGPIYLVIALGFLAGRAGTFSKLDMRVLGTYVVKFALPALVFTALSQRPVGEVMNGRYVLGYAVGSLVVMMSAFGWAWRWQGKSFTLSALCGLGCSSSNSGFIGYPIAILAAGPSSAAVGLAMCMLVENLLMIPLTLVMADSGRAGAGKWHRILVQSLTQLSRNPVILAIAGRPGRLADRNPDHWRAGAHDQHAGHVLGGRVALRDRRHTDRIENQGHAAGRDHHRLGQAHAASPGGGTDDVAGSAERSNVAGRGRGLCCHADAQHLSHPGPEVWI